ncbi:hypothetical protein GCM10027569_75940 [Flindersiella endophytica]
MRARDLVRPFPSAWMDTAALDAAKLMARTRSPLAAVVDPAEGMQGAITLDGMLDEVLPG